MKKLILLELTLLFLATTFSSDNPPGWYQQTLPVSDQINDIFFLDSLNGWIVTPNGHILHTSNGGDDWNIQIDSGGNLNTVQFINSQTGYSLGNVLHGIFYKTTNGGSNWNLIHDFNPAGIFRDMSFVNKDTGWVCSNDPFDGGVFRTTNAGISWEQQLNYGINNPNRIFFINKDTGWTSNGDQDKLYKTINGGQNWNLLYTHTSQINDIYFFDGNTGILTGGINYRTVDGGLNWTQSIGNLGGIKISMGTDSVGWSGTNAVQRIRITTDGGISWGNQEILFLTGNKIPSAVNDLTAWAGGSNGIAHTIDGGGPITEVQQLSTEIPDGFMLHQNYPNPFNPKTIIKYQISIFSKVTLTVFDISGKEILKLVNGNQSAGSYQYTFDGTSLSSSAYIYRLEAESHSNIFSETKMMILVK